MTASWGWKLCQITHMMEMESGLLGTPLLESTSWVTFFSAGILRWFGVINQYLMIFLKHLNLDQIKKWLWWPYNCGWNHCWSLVIKGAVVATVCGSSPRISQEKEITSDLLGDLRVHWLWPRRRLHSWKFWQGVIPVFGTSERLWYSQNSKFWHSDAFQIAQGLILMFNAFAKKKSISTIPSLSYRLSI